MSGRVLSVGLALLVLAGAPALHADADGLTAEITKMLGAELSEEIILDWLDAQPAPTEPLSADALVALKKAGASDALMKRLLAMSKGATSEPTGQPTPPEAAPVTAPAAETTAPPAPASPTDPSANAMVDFRLSYLERVDEEEVGAVGAWDLFLYIDGIPITFMTGNELSNQPSVLEFRRALPPGEHSIRVTQERHFRRGGRWHHETRVAGSEFRFELEPGVPARLDFDFVERLMDYQDPLQFSLVQGEDVVDSGRVGGDAEFWPALCEDIEASVPEGKKPTRRQRRHLESCVDWDGMWSDMTVPSRSEVLEAMADFDFRPRPKGS